MQKVKEVIAETARMHRESEDGSEPTSDEGLKEKINNLFFEYSPLKLTVEEVSILAFVMYGMIRNPEEYLPAANAVEEKPVQENIKIWPDLNLSDFNLSTEKGSAQYKYTLQIGMRRYVIYNVMEDKYAATVSIVDGNNNSNVLMNEFFPTVAKALTRMNEWRKTNLHTNG